MVSYDLFFRGIGILILKTRWVALYLALAQIETKSPEAESLVFPAQKERPKSRTFGTFLGMEKQAFYRVPKSRDYNVELDKAP